MAISQEIKVGNRVIDDGGQNGPGTVTAVNDYEVQADWELPSGAIVRGWLGRRWVRKIGEGKSGESKRGEKP